MKHETRTDDLNDSANWALDCQFRGCGERFDPEAVMASVSAHCNRHVGGRWFDGAIVEIDKPHVLLVWIGVGPTPKGKPNWIQ